MSCCLQLIKMIIIKSCRCDYEPLFKHMDYYTSLVNKDPVKGMAEYLDRYVYGPKIVDRLPRACSDLTICSKRRGVAGASPMRSAADYTASELLAVMSSRLLKDGQVVFAGVGIPLLAATLAQGLHCPGLTILFEGGVIGPIIEPGKLPPSTNEQRCTTAPTWCSAAPTCCCSCSAAMSTSASWAARRSTSTAISTPRSSAIRRIRRRACREPAAATTSRASRR